MSQSSYQPDIRFKCLKCPYKTLYESGAAQHSKETGHLVTDAPLDGTD